MDCIFCKIIEGSIPCKKIFEDDRVLAFADINPAAPVHVLVIPKAHIGGLSDVTDADEALLGHLLVVCARLAAELGLSDGWRLVSNCGAHGGQTVPHLHFHILGGTQLSLTMV